MIGQTEHCSQTVSDRKTRSQWPVTMVTTPLFKRIFGHITHTESQQDKSVTNGNKLITLNFNTFFSAEMDTGKIKGSDLSANSLE